MNSSLSRRTQPFFVSFSATQVIYNEEINWSSPLSMFRFKIKVGVTLLSPKIDYKKEFGVLLTSQNVTFLKVFRDDNTPKITLWRQMAASREIHVRSHFWLVFFDRLLPSKTHRPTIIGLIFWIYGFSELEVILKMLIIFFTDDGWNIYGNKLISL